MKTSFFTIALLSLFLSLYPSLSQRCNKKDEKILLRIKKSFGNPDVLTTWTKEIDCCSWYSVQCDEYTDRISALTIFSGNISGRITEAIGNLPYLETLILRKLTNLTGQIPSSIAKLTKLKTLTISYTNISGPIPSFLSQIKSLATLDLSYNGFTGTIPPELSLLPKLRTLRLDRNRLTGTIPESFGNFTGRLPAIYLSHNLLNGSVPQSMAQVNFTALDLSRNRLMGDLSVFFGMNKTIKAANFSRNLFEFNFSNLNQFPESLSVLDLNHNRIYGSLPATLTGLKLQTWNVSFNRLCGEIPTGGSLQKYDSSAYFHNQCLCGSPLPAC